MMKKNIALVGFLGLRTNQLDGQTVKTRSIAKIIEPSCKKLAIFDTQDFRYSKLSVFKMFYMVARAHKLVYVPAHNNLKYLFPLIWIVAKLCNTQIYYFVVGGWLPLFIQHLPIHRFMLRHISGIYPQTKLQVDNLHKWYGMNNVSLFPNFRFTDNFKATEYHVQGKLRLVFMARVTREKGLDMIFLLGNYLNKKHLSARVEIDFYGQISPRDKEYFYRNIEKYSFMNYCGVLVPNEIYPVLERYDAMLLPTHFKNEGIPGSIIDAYISGIPVIVTEWTYAHELIDDDSNGIIIPFEHGQEQLNSAVERLLNNEVLLQQMKSNVRNKSENYSEKNMRVRINKILFD